MSINTLSSRLLGYLGAVWGLAGIAVLLGYSVWRLAGGAADAWAHEFHVYHWVVLAAHVAFMAWSEGYRGFQQSFSPRIVARAKYLMTHPRPAHVLLAPLFCMGYFHATKRRMISVYALTVFIVLLIVAVRWLLAQPWRGIVDAGVVVGLLWGLISMGAFTLRALTDDDYPYAPEVPES
jgi:hypothetical protein